MSHRIDIEAAIEQIVGELLEDPDGRDVEVERDHLLSVIYAWRDETTPAAVARATESAAVGGAGLEESA